MKKHLTGQRLADAHSDGGVMAIFREVVASAGLPVAILAAEFVRESLGGTDLYRIRCRLRDAEFTTHGVCTGAKDTTTIELPRLLVGLDGGVEVLPTRPDVG